ncbi:unnamed protein product, partial [Meganyctiphanes norvegica]
MDPGTCLCTAKYDFTVLCRNCEEESPTPTLCDVTGVVPRWLDGQLIYNGPGKNKVGESSYKHTFDASALLQKFDITKGQILYSNSFLRSKVYEANQASGKISKAEFGTPAPKDNKSRFSKFMSAMDPEKLMSDNALVSVVEIGGNYYALPETPFMLKIDPVTLKTLERFNINKTTGLTTQSPHPLVDKDGSIFSIGQAVGITGPKYNIIRYPPDG